ncbi:ribosome biogenesis protein BMS1 homolog [Pectinophora gossypiella]|uniref:ribosome biogenesis protein BMS1 homolog n=1 Tax=Pectinophora gossypiella TaxID=13191 RepID=UPI00214E242E|nr:ribosome biogenesis protein BMS1 homolog [Pectinophora gossypiella]
MADESAFDKKKAHRAKHAGRKAEKKKKKNQLDQSNLSARQRNPKAFAIQSAVRAERQFRRREDVIAKKQHIPKVDKTPVDPPPIVVAVVGPPRVGKTTLINNLIKSFIKTNVTSTNGPITIVTSKKRRLTLIECNNDVNSMIDIAKCADLVLLLCDASFGFEMEIFEFLNICQVHGMPKIMGVLTHLDMIKNAKTLKMTKKTLKHRFWTEVYPGAKLFYLSGIVHGEYLRNEIKNLSRFISVMKFRPLSWRSTHAYILADRLEDITSQEAIRKDPKVNREVVLYGYVRGVPLMKESMVHIAGVGDMKVNELSYLPDPCPLPSSEKKRHLMERERQIYAPFSGVGGIVYDKDAVYIELKGSHSHKQEDEETNEKKTLLKNVVETRETVDEQMQESGFKLFSGGAVIYPDMVKDDEYLQQGKKGESSDESDDDSDSDNDSGIDQSEKDVSGKAAKLPWDNNSGSEAEDEDQGDIEKSENENSNDEEEKDSEDSEEEDFDTKWKEKLGEKATEAYFERQKTSKNIMKLVYGEFEIGNKTKGNKEESEEDSEDDEIGGLFKKVTDTQKKKHKEKERQDMDECSFFYALDKPNLRDWTTDINKQYIINNFVTGKRSADEDASELLKLDDASDGDDDEVYGDFEDLETGEKHVAENKPEEDAANKEEGVKRKAEPTKAEIIAKKMKLKAKFDSEYDNPDDHRIKGDHSYYEALKAEALKQSELNKSVFENLDQGLRIEVEGFRPGLYVRMLFKNMPSEFVTNFDPSYPILIGALNMAEQNIGFVSCKVKKHRWYKKILKTNDPLIISLGWRRFQTLPIYSKIEDDLKCRYLKYTPEHVTCNMHFYGPITPQNTGFLALQTVNNNSNEIKQLGFRIAATGSVNEINKSTQIVKKLKLVGTPLKIYKKTAFIKDMFTSTLEVAKFEGARVKTVSGIRGQIKKALNKPEGAFRATFEDKILMSDIIFCRTWFKVDVTKYYAPVVNLLLPVDAKNAWQGMKTKGQLKRERNIKNDANTDSMYTQIERQQKVFKPLVIPKTLQKGLPYRFKPKEKSTTLSGKKPQDVFKNRVAVVKSPHEQKVSSVMKMLKTNYEKKKEVQKEATAERLKAHKKQQDEEEWRKIKRQKELKKKICRHLSKMGNKKKPQM